MFKQRSYFSRNVCNWREVLELGKKLYNTVAAWLATLLKEALESAPLLTQTTYRLLCQPEARDMPGTSVLQHKILQQKGTVDHTCWATA